MASQSNQWTWMIVVIVMIAVTTVIAVVTLACHLFCKCKKDVRRGRTVGVATDADIDKSVEDISPPPNLPDTSRSTKKHSNRITPATHSHRDDHPASSRASIDDAYTPRDANHFFYSSRQAWMFEPD